MNFRTQIPIKKELNQINYDSTILMIGSCFTEHIGDKLNYFKFQHSINPFGIVFHPIAIETFITNCINKERYTKERIFHHNELWHSFDAHSNLSTKSEDDLLDVLNSRIQTSHDYLINATHIILTIGTAWVYRHIDSNCIVANCHKMPQKKFLKELLSVRNISESLDSTVALIKEVNPKAQIIFTVSPVRHLKDGFIENSRSKSHLLAAIHELVEPRNGSFYFPAYEIMMDDLRDYRFYSNDMLHPNSTAIDYIWKQFKASWIQEETFEWMKDIAVVQKGLAHKAFHPNSIQHQQFLEILEAKKDRLLKKNIRF